MLIYAKDPGAYDLHKAHHLDAGFDISCCETVEIPPHQICLIDTGIHLGIKPWQIAFIHPRSSTMTSGLLVGTGVIDAGYLGSVKIQTFNLTDEPITVTKGRRLAQIVVQNNSEYIQPANLVSLEDLINAKNELDTRGINGFGSSGL